MSEITLRDPFFAEETRGYKRDLVAEMIIRSYENQVRGKIDTEHTEATKYILSQLDQKELGDAMEVAEQEIQEIEEDNEI
jgi:hypothetical protein